MLGEQQHALHEGGLAVAGQFGVAAHLCKDALRIIRMFRERGVAVVSVQEPWPNGLDATTELLTAIAGWVAAQESKRRSERIRAGIARRRAAGLPVGGRQIGARDLRPRRRRGSARQYAQAGG